jgi:hypothetical protein
MRTIVLRLAPSAIIAAALAWCCWPYLDPGPPTLDPQGSASVPVIELNQPQQEQQPDCERDPFRPLRALVQMVETVASPTGDIPKNEPAAEASPPVDPAETIERLTLNATLIRGARRRAIIDGRSYEEGDRLSASERMTDPFLIEHIAAHQVMIGHHGKRYALRYRDALPKPRPVPAEDNPQIGPAADPNPQS